MQKITAALLGLLILGASTCAGPGAASLGEVGEVVTVVGLVEGIDTSPLAYDGPAVLTSQTREHGRVTVHIQSCLAGCALTAVEQLDEIRPGETWQVTAELTEDGTLEMYLDGHHHLAPLRHE